LGKFYFLCLLGMVLLLILLIIHQGVVEADQRMKVIIDRFEADYAVVELPDQSTVNMPLKLLAPGVKEGDIIEIKVLAGETKSRRQKINQLLEEVFEK
jgi:uncharacterized Fe-S cluster-containing protein